MKSISKNKYQIGLKGQDLVENRLKNLGYLLYKKNLKQIGLELDLVVYKFFRDKNHLLIHIVEVKTRKNVYEIDLETLGIGNKWKKVRTIMFDIPDYLKQILSINNCTHKITFDLAIVSINDNNKNLLKLDRYIRDVNLLL